MAICEWCNKEFDPDEAEEYFNSEAGILIYQNIRKCLCGDCAVEAINDEVEGVYYETCENCGKVFDVFEDMHELSEEGISLYDCWDDEILCADCARDYVDNLDCDIDGYDDDNDNDDSSESLSVDEAAEIWLSHGMDEDYTFGYTEEELRNALR